jgi:hypothetical protein
MLNLKISPEVESAGGLTTLISEDEYEKDKLIRDPCLPRLSPPRFKYQAVWHRMCFHIKVRKALSLVNEEILQYGTSSDFIDLNNNFKTKVSDIFLKKLNKQEDFRRLQTKCLVVPWHVIHPESFFSNCWSLVVSGLLLYTASVMPVRVAFYDDVIFDAWTVADLCIDFCFFLDIIFSCLTAYELKEGLYEINHRAIFVRYLKTWLVFDTLACLPFSFIEYGSDANNAESSPNHYNNLIRLMRVPRLYKLLHILRIAKALKGYNSPFIRGITDYIRANSRKC